MKIRYQLIVTGLLICGLASAQEGVDHLAPPCDGPFCDLPGGVYLNAIYRQDRETIARIDRQYLDEVERLVQGTSKNMGFAEDDPVFAMLANVTRNTERFISRAANKYLYEFRHWPAACRKPGAAEKTFVKQGPDMVDVDEYGFTQVIEKGEIYRATYVTNPEFFTLRDQVGSAHGARSSDLSHDIEMQRLIYQGLEQMQSKYRCNSDAVQGFERGLRVVTTQARAEKPELTLSDIFAPLLGQSTDSTTAGNANGRTTTDNRTRAGVDSQDSTGQPQQSRPATQAQTQIQSQTQTLAQVQAQAEAQAQAQAQVQAQALARLQAETETRAQAQAAARAEAQARAQEQAERYQQMNAELQQLSVYYTKQLTVLNERLNQDMQSATTTEARLAAQQTYQQGLRELQQDMQTKTTAIRNQWQPGQTTVNPPPASAQTNANSEATTAGVADQQQMNAELQALSTSYMRRIQLLGDSLKQEVQSAASTDERNRLLQTYQEQLLQLQQQAQAETRAIRERYQQQQ